MPDPNPDLDDLANLFAEVDERIATEDAAATPTPTPNPDVDALAEVLADVHARLAAEAARGVSTDPDDDN